MNLLDVLRNKTYKKNNQSVRWKEVEQENLHTVDEQAFPAQPCSLPLPNEILREASSIGDLSAFYAIGEAWSHLIANYLPPNPVVLDLGCGCGKLARFLYLNPNLRYIGVDVYEPAVNWCQRAFANSSDRFKFIFFDGDSELYNPNGSVASAEYKFPVGDQTIDMTVCASLFTHLYETEVNQYLSEIYRVTKPGGQAVISIHAEPKNGEVFSGDQTRIDIDPKYFRGLCEMAKLSVAEVIGVVYGQTVFRLVKR